MLTGKRHRDNEDGQAMVEFAIVFPVLFLLFLMLIQTALLLTARQVVHYASFCAARSAIVWIPAEGNDTALKKAQQAAEIACIPISPRLTRGFIRRLTAYKFLSKRLERRTVNVPPIVGLTEKIRDLRRQMMFGPILRRLRTDKRIRVLDFMARARGKVIQRYPVAHALTQTEFLFDGRPDDVTAKITHYYAMRIPIVNKIFYYMHLAFSPGERKDARIKDRMIRVTRSLGLYLLPIRARTTLTLEKEVNCCP
ncbi:MAG: hypothetical protein GY868_06550 [Deltaproteobacteria bacterium]|nr:hypothetical protein [Deltaproteobacteria bacterium]